MEFIGSVLVTSRQYHNTSNLLSAPLLSLYINELQYFLVWHTGCLLELGSEYYMQVFHTDFQLRVWGDKYSKHEEKRTYRLSFLVVLFSFFHQDLEGEFPQSHRNRSGFQPAEGGVSPVVWGAHTRPSYPPDPDVSGWGGRKGLDIWSESPWRDAESGWWRFLLGDFKSKVQVCRSGGLDHLIRA